MNLLNAIKKASKSMEVSTSMCITHVLRHLNKRPHLFSILHPILSENVPKQSIPESIVGALEGVGQPSVVLWASTATYNTQNKYAGAYLQLLGLSTLSYKAQRTPALVLGGGAEHHTS